MVIIFSSYLLLSVPRAVISDCDIVCISSLIFVHVKDCVDARAVKKPIFLGKQKNIITLSSDEFAKRVVKVDICSCFEFLFLFLI